MKRSIVWVLPLIAVMFLYYLSPSFWGDWAGAVLTQGKLKIQELSDPHAHDDDHKALTDKGHGNHADGNDTDHEKHAREPADEDQKHAQGHHDEHGDHGDEHRGEHDEHGGSKFGEGKTISDTREQDKAFQLSEKATSVLKIKTKFVRQSGRSLWIPEASFVEFQQHSAVYRLREGWYELVEVNPISRSGGGLLVSSKNLKKGQQVVISGVPLLHVAYLEASGQGGEGHAH